MHKVFNTAVKNIKNKILSLTLANKISLHIRWGWQTTIWGPNPAHHLFLSVFVHKVLLEDSYAHLRFVCGYFPATMEELSNCDRGSMACKA